MSEFLGPEAPGYLGVCWVIHVDGVVLGHGHCATADLVLQTIPEGRARLMVTREAYEAVSAEPESWHVEDDELVARAASPVEISTASIEADGEDEVAITGIPAGSQLKVRGAVSLTTGTIDDGEAVLTSSAPGRLIIVIQSPPPYRGWKGIVDAV